MVVGWMCPGSNIPPRNGPLPITPGTVVALRGRVTDKPVAPGSWAIVFLKALAVASQHISDNYDHPVLQGGE